jgi:quercetin dioxygenase-like cupin family protein
MVRMLGQRRKTMKIAAQISHESARGPRSVTVLGGIQIVYRAVSEDTDGVYSLFEITMQPGQGPPPHVHSREDESWYVLDGAFDFQIGDESSMATAGWFGLGPRDVPHGIKAAGTGPAKMLMVVTPAGFERFFDELAELTAKPPLDFDRVRALFEKYGMQIIEPKVLAV